MAFFRDVFNNLRKKNINEYPPLKVVEVKAEDYLHYETKDRHDCLILHSVNDGNSTQYEIVLYKQLQNRAAFSLCRSEVESVSMAYFNSLSDKLPKLMEICPSLVTLDMLQLVFNYTKDFPQQNLSHVAAHFGIVDYFKHPTFGLSSLDVKCPDTGLTPLHCAVRSGKLQVVQTLLSLGAKIDIYDKDRNNPLHFAASTSKEIISAICSCPQAASSNMQSLINTNNNDIYSPLHLACLFDKPECVKELLKNGADVNGASIAGVCSGENQREFSKSTVIDQLETKDMKNGGTPLHWSRSAASMEPLLEMGCDIEARNFQGETVLHIMVAKNRLACVVLLLSHGADVNAVGPNGNTPIHIAAKESNISIVQALIVFGANVNIPNNLGESPRHIAATAKQTLEQNMILYVLHTVGAKRCSTNKINCNDGCSHSNASHFNGIPPENSPFKRSEPLYDCILGSATIKKAVEAKRKAIFEDTKKMEIDSEPDVKSCRVLCLDGGGIRGLLLIQMLWFIEELTQKKISESFDFIAGTSTGGILALLLSLGHSASECRQLYFRLKDKIFVGSRPYDSEHLENFLRTKLGEDVRMSDIKKPKVMLTATIADRFPPEFYLFRNYESASDILGIQSPQEPKSQDQLAWKAARSSGAAPTYFRACDCYLDGGLISNNPTLDALTEIHLVNKAMEATGQENKKVKISVVVSLGTGSIPTKEIPIIDICRPDSVTSIARIAFMAPVLGELLIEQSTQAIGQVVERARSWCSMIDVPYFRLNPPLSEAVQLDEKDNIKLVNMLWEATAYLNSRRNEIDELILLLN